jgi:hypothetical protein
MPEDDWYYNDMSKIPSSFHHHHQAVILPRRVIRDKLLVGRGIMPSSILSIWENLSASIWWCCKILVLFLFYFLHIFPILNIQMTAQVNFSRPSGTYENSYIY